WGHWAIFPLFLAVGFAAFYGVFGVTGQTSAAAAAQGWLPMVSATAAGIPIFDFTELALVDWSVVAGQAGSIVTVAILCSIILLLDISGIEIITARELSPDRELKVAGLTNIVNGLASGFPGVHVASDTAFTYKLGGDSRLMGLVYAGAVMLAIAAGTGFIGAIPTFILGGLLIYVGIDFLVDWAWHTRRDLPLADYLVILLILGVIASVGILEGVAFGFAVAVVLFVVTYSRLSVIKSEMHGGERASNDDRDPESRAILNREGHRILIVRLQGFIFFGTADRLLATVKERLSARGGGDGGAGIDYLVLDFRHVSQMDSSAIHMFSKLTQLADGNGVHIVLTGISEAVENRLERMRFFSEEGAALNRLCFDHLDAGTAWCEEHILEGFEHRDKQPVASLEARLAQLLGSGGAAADIAHYFTPVAVTKGEYLFRQGAAGDSLYLVHSGVAAVVILLLDGRQRVVRIFREGAVLGEMALYTGAPRSASVRIEESGTLYRLDSEQLDAMQREHPAAADYFHAFVVRLLAERLDRANRELQRYS
ncbi:MAG: SLC26A/SulP transporter family protein, partial [Proteobacteria bacterium]|nr:SLC26A/SulP transporter family protein [Pseudomonadota bacterium]